eukprot:gene8383-8567_t
MANLTRKATSLIRDMITADGRLPVYNEDAVRQAVLQIHSHQEGIAYIISEFQKAHEQRRRQQQQQQGSQQNDSEVHSLPDWSKSPEHAAAIVVHHETILRLKRILCTYTKMRADVLIKVRWHARLLPESLKDNMSPQELQFWWEYDDMLNKYMGPTEAGVGLDLTLDAYPPKGTHVDVMVLQDLGSFAFAHSMCVPLIKGSVHNIKAIEAEHMVRHGLLEAIQGMVGIIGGIGGVSAIVLLQLAALVEATQPLAAPAVLRIALELQRICLALGYSLAVGTTAWVKGGFLDANALDLVTLALETVPIYNSRHEQRAVNRLLRAALSHDAFLKPLAAALIKQSSGILPPQHAFTLLEWSCLVLEQLPSEGSKKATQKLLEVQANLLDTFPLLAALQLPQLTETLLPAVSKAMRRTPEPAIAALAAALQYVQLDLSSSALELVGLLVQQLRAKEAVRGSAGAALAAVAAGVRDPAVGQQLVGHVSRLLGGSSAEGKIKAAAERTALAAALTALSSLPPDSCLPAAVDAATFCSTYYKEEPVEDVKLALLSCLAAWLPACSSVPQVVVTQLAAGLTEPKESLKKGNLRAAVAAVQAAPGLAADLGPLAAPQVKLVAEGMTKAVARGEGIAALLLAAQVAAADPAAAGVVLAKAGVWGPPLAADSPLLSAPTLAKLSPADAAPAAQLAQCLLQQHGQHLKQGSQEVLCQLLALCLLHHSPQVRRAGGASGRALLAGQPALMGPLLEGLRHWANRVHEALVLAVRTGGGPEGTAAPVAS